MRGAFDEIVKLNQDYGNSPNEYLFDIKPTLDEHQRTSDKNMSESQEKLKTEKRQKWQKHRKEINRQLKLFGGCIPQTSLKTARNLLFERRFEGLSLFEEILQTPGMKELIELIFEISDTVKNEYILQTVSCSKKYVWDCSN